MELIAAEVYKLEEREPQARWRGMMAPHTDVVEKTHTLCAQSEGQLQTMLAVAEVYGWRQVQD